MAYLLRMQTGTSYIKHPDPGACALWVFAGVTTSSGFP